MSGQYGVCLDALNCEAFKTERNKLGICSFKGIIPVVCCPKKQQSVTRVSETNVRRISAIKCDEYTKEKKVMRFKRAAQFLQSYSTENPRPPDIGGFVGGTRASLSEFPHMSAIGLRQLSNDIDWLCGGSLISEKFVLSAAHCALLGRRSPDVIRIGDQNLLIKEHEISPQEFGVKNIIVHPQYKTSLKYHDLALFELSTPAQFTRDVLPACLYQKSTDPSVNAELEGMGYGQTSFAGQQSNALLKGPLTIVDNRQCNQAYEDDTLELPQGITSCQMCAWDPEGKRDTCQGDSGGPLQIPLYVRFDKFYEIVGVTSFGKYCAAGVPGVYIRVYSYLDWIESVVWK